MARLSVQNDTATTPTVLTPQQEVEQARASLIEAQQQRRTAVDMLRLCALTEQDRADLASQDERIREARQKLEAAEQALLKSQRPPDEVNLDLAEPEGALGDVVRRLRELAEVLAAEDVPLECLGLHDHARQWTRLLEWPQDIRSFIVEAGTLARRYGELTGQHKFKEKGFHQLPEFRGLWRRAGGRITFADAPVERGNLSRGDIPPRPSA